MTIARRQQIRAAEMAGTPLDLAPEERAEYAAGNELVRTALEDRRPALGGGSAVLPVISALNRGPSNKFLADMETTQRRNQKMMDDFGKKMAEDRRSKAAAQAAEAEAERIRDEQMALQTKALSTLASQSLGQSKFNWWVLVIGLLTLIATVAGTVVGIVALARPGG